MIRLLVIISSVITLFTMLPAQGLRSNSYAEQKNIVKVPNRDKILSVFKKAIDLNEDFKNTVHTIPLSEHQKKRTELEKFNDEILALEVEDCVKLLSEGRDIGLAAEFSKLLISYKNSANERLSYALGEVFLNNPDLIAETFDKFQKSDQQYLCKTLDWGWCNVIFDKDISQPTLQDRTKRLKELRFRALNSANNPQTEIKEPQNIQSLFHNKDKQASEPYWEKKWFYPAISGVVAVLVSLMGTWLISACYRWKARRSLIIAFASELVLAFHRCIIYYRQQFTERLKKAEVSYSELFEFTDASMLSNFSTVGPKPELIAAIVFLKARYFQISRHIREAAKYALESKRAGSKMEETRLFSEAVAARGTALAFFLPVYNDIVEKTDMIIKEVIKIKFIWSPKKKMLAKYFTSVFTTARDVKSKLDKLDKTKITANKLEEELEKLRQKLDMCLIEKN